MGEQVGWLRRRLGVRASAMAREPIGEGIGVGFATGLLAAIEERFFWSRFGL